MTACETCMKYSLFLFNLFFALCGLVLIVIGSVGVAKESNVSDLVSNEPNFMSIRLSAGVAIFVGIIVFFVSTVGCCGAIRESRYLLITYAVFLLIILVVQIGIGIFALSQKNAVVDAVNKGLENEFSKIKNDSKVRDLFDEMQKSMECCGVKGSGDYAAQTLPVPGSCCEDKSNCTVKPNTYWKEGCADAFVHFLWKAGAIMSSLCLVVAACEVIGTAFALRLAHILK